MIIKPLYTSLCFIKSFVLGDECQMDWVREEGDRRSDECLTEWEKRVSERGWLVTRMISEVVNVWRSRRKRWVSKDDWRRGWVIGVVSNVMTEWEKRVSERCAEAWEGEGETWFVWQRQWVRESEAFEALILKYTYLKPSLWDSVSRFETESLRLGFNVFNHVTARWKHGSHVKIES